MGWNRFVIGSHKSTDFRPVKRCSSHKRHTVGFVTQADFPLTFDFSLSVWLY
jgi:hypothetical protein